MKKSNNQLWETVHASRRWGEYPPEDVVRFVANTYGSVPKKARGNISMLDMGCGQGAASWFLAREGFAVTGVDVSPSAIAKSQEYLAKDSLKAVFHVADFKALTLPAGSFDCIFDIESIYTNVATDIKKIYSDVYTFLKPGGSFFAMAFSTDCSNFGTGTKLEEHTYTDIPSGSPSTGVAHYFDREELETLLKSVGFTEIEINQKIVTRNNGRDSISQWIVYGSKK
mgnify:CR=1 FL=1